MKVYLLEKLVNEGTCVLGYDRLSISDSYSKCLDIAKKDIAKERGLSISDMVVTDECKLEEHSFIFKVKSTGSYISPVKFYVWATDLV